MRASRTSALLLSTALSLLVLSGCSVAVIDPPSAQRPVAETPVAEKPVEGDAPSAAPQASTPGTTADVAADRERYAEAASITMPCPTAPLDNDGDIIRVEGPCDELHVEIDAGVLIVDEVGTLVLEGASTVVYARSIGTLTVTGDVNEVYWEGETPDVRDSGVSNVLKKG